MMVVALDAESHTAAPFELSHFAQKHRLGSWIVLHFGSGIDTLVLRPVYSTVQHRLVLLAGGGWCDNRKPRIEP